MSLLFFKIALAAYFFSTIGCGISLLVKRVLVAKVSMWVLLSAFLLQSLAFGFRCSETGGSPILGIYDALALISWIMTGGYLAFQLKTKTMILGAFVSPVAFLLMIIASVRLVDRVPIPAVL